MTIQNSKKIKFLILKFDFEIYILKFALIWILILIFSLFFLPKNLLTQASNNKFGIHLAQPHLEDLKKAAELVNSSGGDWGYVTLVIQENDRNRQKWQEIFDLLRQYHLIPIIRLATVPSGENWRRPDINDASSWIDFLNSLNWVVKHRYIVLFNEPNHGNEWGGVVDPKNYADVAFAFAKALKEKNPDFFVMLAGFDASAPHLPPKFYDEEVFLKEILNFKPEVFNYLDGWVSHSYPNPSFSGSPYDWGRGTVRSYQWELDLLYRLGVKKNLPVFITETGWEMGVKSQRLKVKSLNEEIVGQNFKIAFEQVWLPDERVKAVTPFILDYQTLPFLGFSWKQQGGQGFYQQYYVVQSIPKIKGEPKQVEKGEIIFNLPKELVAKSSYDFSLILKNDGQAIWDKEDGYDLEINCLKKENCQNFDYLFEDLKNIKPFEERNLRFFLKTKNSNFNSSFSLKFVLKKNEKEILSSKNWQLKIIPPPKLTFEVVTFPRIRAQDGDDFELQIFDRNEHLVFKKKMVGVENKKGTIAAVDNVLFGEKYRVVILKPYYLPRQTFVRFQKGENRIKFETMLPLDFNLDGKFDFFDLKAFFEVLRVKVLPN